MRRRHDRRPPLPLPRAAAAARRRRPPRADAAAAARRRRAARRCRAPPGRRHRTGADSGPAPPGPPHRHRASPRCRYRRRPRPRAARADTVAARRRRCRALRRVGPAFARRAEQAKPAAKVRYRCGHTVTVTALDQFNNTAAGYLGQVHFTKSDSNARWDHERCLAVLGPFEKVQGCRVVPLPGLRYKSIETPDLIGIDGRSSEEVLAERRQIIEQALRGGPDHRSAL
jgi:hypothetical protein